ncbi:MAG: hypothetical protein QOD74_2914 [Variibacter sp.]|nr:hypothetical protein [Variibacter sp.]
MLDAIILCGGRGSRLSSVVSDVPKPLAPVLGRPFLDHLLAFIAQSGAVEGAVLAIHHLSDRIVSYYETHPAPLPLQFVREPKPLGTGGALFNSMAATQSRTLFCFNGDSLCGGDLTALAEAHRSFGPGFTLGLTHVPDTSRYGSVICDPSDRVLRFSEKSASHGPGLINAGVYVIDREVLGPWNGETLSLETEVLPRLVEAGAVRGVAMAGPFLDIGLPESYAAAEDFIRGFSSS